MVEIKMDLDLQAEYKKAVKTLRGIAHGAGNAETIATTARIPRTSSYKALQSLCRKGFAISTRGRPVIYKPESPQRIKDKLIEEIEDTFDKLGLVHEILMEKGEPQLVYTITGESRVLDKIGELLDNSSRTFILSSPSFSEIRDNLSKKLEAALKRGIRITIIIDPLQRGPKSDSFDRLSGLERVRLYGQSIFGKASGELPADSYGSLIHRIGNGAL
jgi:sugar-specific transcriptional regulator TrmB